MEKKKKKKTKKRTQPTDTTSPNRSTKRPSYKPKKKMKTLSLKEELFAQEYVRNGMNATEAALTTTNHQIKRNSAQVKGYIYSNKPIVRERIVELMRENGAGEEQITCRIGDQLRSNDTWAINEGIKHGIKVLGLAAPSESHVKVDKREVSVQINANEAKQMLTDLIKDSKA